jgi:hypothetical protein
MLNPPGYSGAGLKSRSSKSWEMQEMIRLVLNPGFRL